MDGHAATFNADRIRAPIMLQRNSGGIANILESWEMFSMLRSLCRPVELYVSPDIEHGEHGLELPRQQYGSLERAVDGFDFWLNGHEDIAPAKRAQYAAWRQLRADWRRQQAWEAAGNPLGSQPQ